jgi:hypothetical protein
VAFRLGVLLCKLIKGFDKFSNLLWENVAFEHEKVSLYVNWAMCKGPLGDSEKLFEIPVSELCPVAAQRVYLLRKKS